MQNESLLNSTENEGGLPAEILTQIKARYPFLSEDEYSDYMKKVGEVSSEDPIGEIKSLIALLDNPHASVRKIEQKELTSKSEVQPNDLPSSELIDNVLYMQVPSLWKVDFEHFEKAYLPSVSKSEGLILDLRGNRGGDELGAVQFARKYLIKEGTHIIGTTIKRIPDKNLDFMQSTISAASDNPYTKPIVLLTDNKVFSSAERFISRMRAGTECTIIGTETNGGSANPVRIPIEYKGEYYIIAIPTWRFILKGETLPIEETKIKPDITYAEEDIVNFAVQHIKNLP